MSLIAPSDRVMLTPLADGTGVLLHLDTMFYYTLNETGVFVWNRLTAAPATAEDLTRALVETFRVDEQDAETDIATLLAELSDEDLVRHP